jgi:mRNA-degrading endonuclease YafQ of YafQ-DinJ toxin-antitoxin module
MIKIHYLKKFFGSARKLSSDNLNLLYKKIEIFQINSNDPRLKTHKLQGRLSEKYSFSVNYTIRVVFQYINSNEVIFLEVGTHEVYK